MKLIKDVAKLRSKKTVQITLVIFTFILLIVSVPTLYAVIFWGKIFPGVKIANVDVGGLTEQEAIQTLKNEIQEPEKINYLYQDRSFSIPSKEISFYYKYEETVDNAFQTHRSDSIFVDIFRRFDSLLNEEELPIQYNIDKESLLNNLSVIAGQLSVEPVEPKISMSGNVISVSNGQAGKDVDTNNLLNKTIQLIESNNFEPINVLVKDVDPRITDQEAELLKEKAERISAKTISLYTEDVEIVLETSQTLNLLAFEGINTNAFENLISNLKDEVEREPQNAAFRFTGGTVQEFKPAKDGISIDENVLKERILNTYNDLEDNPEENITIEIPVVKTSPTITTSEVNDLGINELIGKGESTYRGSIANRVYNVDLAASKFNGTLVAPGEIFSFNETIGDISVYTGFKQAYVIKDGKTVLGDGGGVCQVSTTMFRAALDAGLPITERSPHSYRVTYYEQGYKAGLDATIYSPVTDLKFKNDTPNYILIQTISNPENYYLAFEIYGTSDGRESNITNHYVSSPIPPPEDLYIDDPTLPQGQVKQIDWAAWGAKASFDYTVERNGEVIYEKTFYSNYRPWQAKFLRGTGPPDSS